MRIIIGADHRGFPLKEGLKTWLAAEGHEIVDVGAATLNPVDDYPDFGAAVGRAVAADKNARGVVLCGSGIGIAIAANKVAGVRAGTITTPEQAAAARADEDLNVLALSADALSLETTKPIVTTFLATPFSGAERHVRRIQKFDRLRWKNEQIAYILLWTVRIALVLVVVGLSVGATTILIHGRDAICEENVPCGRGKTVEPILEIIGSLYTLSIYWMIFGFIAGIIGWSISALRKIPTRAWKHLFWWSTLAIIASVLLAKISGYFFVNTLA